MNIVSIASVVLTMALATTNAAARTWYIVPDGSGDAPTIQAGLDSAASGDTVLVACGTYYENDITMKAGVVLRSVTGMPECVTIDAEELGRVIYCPEGDANTRLEGLTLTRGYAQEGAYLQNLGGGLFLYGSLVGPIVKNCVFLDNRADGHGGGVHGGYSGTPSFIGCFFQGNSAGTDGSGGGFVSGYGASEFCSPTFENCTFLGNSAGVFGGAVSVTGNDLATSSFHDCLFANNSAAAGGAVSFSNIAATSIAGCTFSGDSASGSNGVVRSHSSDVEIYNTIIAFGTGGGAVHCVGGGTATLHCCDVFGNAGGDWTACIAGQDGADGDFSADPLFCDAANGDYHLDVSSPCLGRNHPSGDPCGRIGSMKARCMGHLAFGPATLKREGNEPTEETGANPVTSGALRFGVSPNPARDAATIRFSGVTNSAAFLRLFDIQGRLVRSWQATSPEGAIELKAAGHAGASIAPGVYFLRLSDGEQSVTKRLTLIR
ncbi:MAG: T9SS type A sorting domain-containing protein [Candidatus Eisenbacteria bacterium]